MSKIGLLCLQKGVFHNKRIVSEKWMEESTKVRLRCNEKFRDMMYGYLWWIIDEMREAMRLSATAEMLFISILKRNW